METTEIAKKGQAQLFTRAEFDEPTNFTQLLDACKILVASKILPKEIDTPEKAAVVVLTGRELGLRMMASTRSIYIVNGKPSLSAQMMLSLAYGTKELEDIEISETGAGESASCIVTVKRKGKKPYRYTFSVDMAKKMQKYQNEWLKQPENMCKQRAISGNLRVTFPDAILGMYTPEEVQSIDVDEAVETKPEITMPKPLDMPKAIEQTKPEIVANGNSEAPVMEQTPTTIFQNGITKKEIETMMKLADQAGISNQKLLDAIGAEGCVSFEDMDRKLYTRIMNSIAKKIDKAEKK